MKEKLIALFTAFTFFTFSVCAIAEKNSVAFVSFGEKVLTENIAWSVGDVGNPLMTDDGMVLEVARNNLFLYLNASDSLFTEPDGMSASLTVEYVDSGYGGFTVVYDSLDGAFTEIDDAVMLNNTGEVKTYVFDLSKATFTNRCNGYDMRIALWANNFGLSSGDVIIKSAKIEESFPQKPVKLNVDSEHVGNIFGGEEEKKLNVHLENVTEKSFESEIIYKIYNEEDICVDEGVKEISVEPNGSIAESLELKVSKYGVYSADITVKSHGLIDGVEKNFEVSEKYDLSVVNKSYDVVNENYAVCTHFSQNKSTPQTLSKPIREAGFSMARDDYYWTSVEPVQGVYNLTEKWGDYPIHLKENGVESLVVLAYGNSFVDQGGPPYTEEGLEAFSNYAQWVATKFKDTVKYYEIWNEYNEPHFNSTGRPPEDYAKLIKICRQKIKAIDPDAVIVAGVAATQIDWIRRLFAAGAYDDIDIFAVHPYDFGPDHFRRNYLIDRMESVKELMLEFGEIKPIWYTEVGYTTGSDKGVTEKMQASTVVQLYAVAIGEDIANKLFWYDFMNDGVSKLDREQNWGLIKWLTGSTVPYAAKPSYVAAAGMNKLLAGAEFVDSLEITDTAVAYRFRNNGDDIIIMWSEDEQGESVALNLGSKDAEVLDLYTNSLGKLSSDNGEYGFNLVREIIYVTGDFSDMKICEGDVTFDVSSVSIGPSDIIEIKVNDKCGRNLDFKVDDNAKFEVISTEKTDENNTLIRILDKSTDVDEYKTRISVFDKNDLIYITELNVEVKTPISVTLNTEPFSKTTRDRWRAVISVKNESVTNSVSGKGILTEPAVKIHEIEFKNLKPGETRNIYINLPEMIKKRNFMLRAEVYLDYGYKTELSKEVDFTIGGFAGNKPTIDGKISRNEWKGEWFYADTEISSAVSDWKGYHDISFQSNIMWDDDYFYMAVIANDNVHHQSDTDVYTWRGDSVQFTLHERVEKVSTGTEFISTLGSDDTFTEMAIALTENGPELYRHSAQYDELEAGAVENYDISINREGTKTFYEIKIPWSEIFKKEYKAQLNQAMGFAMIVNDNDGEGRRGWMEYNSGIGGAKSSDLFGTLNLQK